MAQEKSIHDPQPTCAMCPARSSRSQSSRPTRKKAIAEKLVDQQVRDIDIGKAHIGIGMVYRGKLDKPAPDVGSPNTTRSARCTTSSRLRDARPRAGHRQPPAASRDAAHVVEFNGPGNNGSDIRNGVAHQIKAGDVVVIPAGNGPLVHQDRRSHQLPDGAYRSGQGHAAEERGAVDGLPVETRAER